MSFRVVLVESGMKICYKLDNILITNMDKEVRIPLSDVSTIVLDNLDTSITSRALSMIAESNICLIICGKNHLPIGIYNSYCNHSRATKIMSYQLELAQDFKDDLWKKIVINKIANQKKLLIKLNHKDEAIQKLDIFEQEVLPGDPHNREAHAAKVYFNQLMGKSFSRGDDSILLNSGLNYGYTIVRSFIARLCTGYGLHSMLGIHHKNEYNKFNLVDDLIEPIRPIIDLHVYEIMKDSKFFTSRHRESLINFVNHKILCHGKKQYFCNALEEYVSNYVDAIKTKDISKVEFFDINNYLGEI
jgi:CRISPR-associated protein Cas1